MRQKHKIIYEIGADVFHSFQQIQKKQQTRKHSITAIYVLFGFSRYHFNSVHSTFDIFNFAVNAQCTQYTTHFYVRVTHIGFHFLPPGICISIIIYNNWI